ncbi:MAG: GTPase Era [Deinococcales bacterium]
MDSISSDHLSTFSGFVAIVGKPNVGKSTLLNALLGAKVSAVTPKPQTTRRGIRGIYTGYGETAPYQAVFVDTPGLHKPQDALGKFMNNEVHNALSDMDAVLWVVDLRRPPSEEDKLVARALAPFNKPLWLVGNKLDAAKYPSESFAAYAKLLEGKEYKGIQLSAQEDPKAVQKLLSELLKNLPKNPFFFPDFGRSDQSREQWAAEIIREEAMKALRDELPYSIATRVNAWLERENGMQVLEAELIVEAFAHRKIVVGAGGRMLKQIGLRARKQLEVFLSKKVYLQLEVIVMAGWRSDNEALRELGYE